MLNNINNFHEHYYTWLKKDEIINIRNNYKVIDVNFLDSTLVNYKMSCDKFFDDKPTKKEVVNNILKFCFNDKDVKIYKKTDYLCNEKEKICICNIHAEELRKIYDGDVVLNEPTKIYISWIKNKKDHY